MKKRNIFIEVVLVVVFVLYIIITLTHKNHNRKAESFFVVIYDSIPGQQNSIGESTTVKVTLKPNHLLKAK